MMLNSVVVNTNSASNNYLSTLLSDHCPQLKIVSELSEADRIYEALEQLLPDVVFFNMDGDDIGSLQSISNILRKVPFQTVCVTPNDSNSIHAIKAGAADYLLQPVDPAELKDTVAKLCKNHMQAMRERLPGYLRNMDRKIMLPHFSGGRIVPLKDIVHFDADNHYTRVFIRNEPELFLSKPLKYFESRIDGFWFFKLHKSHIINLYHLVAFVSDDGRHALMSNGREIPVSALKIDEFMEKMQVVGLRI